MKNNLLLKINQAATKINEIKSLIKEVYLSDNIPWVIGYSGGKDSTVVCQLVFEALLELKRENNELLKNVYVISSDTLVENPLMFYQIRKTHEAMKEYVNTYNLPIEINIVKPDIRKTFWTNIIGRGYPAPNQTFRWCTDRLKIDPANRFINNLVSKEGEAIMLLGVREGESNSRDRVLESHTIRNKNLMRHTTMKNAYVFAPIRNMTLDDVWNYLLSNLSPWGADNQELYALYSGGQGECPLIIDEEGKSAGTCGNSRFGCWVCTVVTEDKSLTEFIKAGDLRLLPLLNFRNYLYNIRDRADLRSKVRSSGQIYYTPIEQISDSVLLIPSKGSRKKIRIEILGNEKGRDEFQNAWMIFEAESRIYEYIKENNLSLYSNEDLRIICRYKGKYCLMGLGSFTLETRKLLLNQLLDLENELDKSLNYETIISEDEIIEIQKIWEENGDNELSAFGIYNEKKKVDLNAKYIINDIEVFDVETRNIIKSICEQYDIDVNTFEQLLRLEKTNLGSRSRKSIIDKIKRLLNKDYLHI